MKRKKKNSEADDTHRLLELEEKKIAILQQAQETENKKNEDPDAQFLLSILPYIKEFDPLEKLEIRSQIQNVVLNAYRKKKNTLGNRSQLESIQDIQTDLLNQPSVKKMYRPYQESSLNSTLGQSQWSMSDNVDNMPRIAGMQQASDVLLGNNQFNQDFFNLNQQTF